MKPGRCHEYMYPFKGLQCCSHETVHVSFQLTEKEKKSHILYQQRPYNSAQHHTKWSVLGSLVIAGIPKQSFPINQYIWLERKKEAAFNLAVNFSFIKKKVLCQICTSIQNRWENSIFSLLNSVHTWKNQKHEFTQFSSF